MNQRKIFYLLYISIICLLLFSELYPKEPQKFTNKNSISQNIPKFSKCNISNLSYLAVRNGSSLIDNSKIAGYYPRSTSYVLYADGLLISGHVQDNVNLNWPKLRVIGGLWGMYTSPGWIEQPGDGQNLPVPISPENSRARVYRIRRDFENLTPEMPEVIRDAAEMNFIDLSAVTEEMSQAVIDQYHLDWQEWPVDLGAPLIDQNGNGQWDHGEGIADADQIIWFVFNDADLTKTTDLAACPPLGLEIQATIWGYNHPNARLGQTVFKKYSIINKSGFTIDSMYFAQSSDPDIGYWQDDLAGCDSILGLGYTYNGAPTDILYDRFGLAPPAAGYDILGGPLIHTGNNSDTAIFNLNYKIGYKNLPLTSFSYWSAGDPILTDFTENQGSYSYALSAYNLLRGFRPTTNIDTPTCYIHRTGPYTGKCTKFPLNGDPVTGTGDIDGSGGNIAPGDRRIFLSTGPFSMASGDTQEVVIALIGGISDNNLSSIVELKENDLVAQELHNNLFSGIPKAPPAPRVQIFSEENKITLNWGYDQIAVDATENSDLAGYQFEGYNLYQLPSQFSTKSEAVRIATFDIINGVTTIYGEKYDPNYNQVINVPIQYGTDRGIQRYFHITKNFLNDKPLYAGNRYYFAVTAYNNNAEPEIIEDQALESALSPIPVVPQPPNPGIRYSESAGTIIQTTQSSGDADAQVEVEIVDPNALLDANHLVTFSTDTNWTSPTSYQLVDSWSLIRGNDTLINKNTNFDINSNDIPIQNGFITRVGGDLTFEPAVDFSEYQINPEINSGNYAIGSFRIFGYQTAKAIDTWGLGTNDENILEKDVRIIFNGEYQEPDTVISGPDTLVLWRIREGTGSIATFGGSRNYDIADHPMQNDISTNRTQEGYFQIRIPFEVWNIDDNQQINVVIYDRIQTLPNSNKVNFYAFNPHDLMYTWIMNKSYEGQLTDPDGIDGEHLTWNQVWGWTAWHKDDEVYFHYKNRVIPGVDEFTFSTQKAIHSPEIAKTDVESINVFPNPYYAFHSEETHRNEKFVTFNHLPEEATIRIFNLTGTQVRKLEKRPGDGSGQFLRWDLNNQTGLPVASGLYIAYIDMPDLGKSKAVKFYVIQRRQVISTY